MPRQLAGVWVIGSVLMGTLAVLFTLDRGPLPFRPLAALPVVTLVGVLGVAAALVAALGLLAWGTPGVSWLPETPRGRVLWVVLVAVGGVAGCGFLAAVTFAVGLPLDAQLVLGYVAGGLPFALVAAMLVRPAAVNVAAVVLAGALVVAGFVVAPAGLVRECAGLLVLLVTTW
ncbi:hypothetical protein [Actinophytocola gossypii]|uniref:Tripartite tricarboxylate transporter TctB family protein n=1 Tax=Actinophytocola gossypii TaxID=2812003 RepID=A0ABT2JII0_9PSEU|nr:hypothetical protein [Actinophytocola gossypii]MCT2587329.1 hypothetical protein [Actinophytocola gossypii]